MKIENYDRNQFLEISFKYEFDWYITFDIFWKNEFYSWKGTICISKSELLKFINNLSELTLWAKLKINDYDSDSYIEVAKVNDIWHFIIDYQIWWSHQENYSKLVLYTDTIGVLKFHDLNIL